MVDVVEKKRKALAGLNSARSGLGFLYIWQPDCEPTSNAQHTGIPNGDVVENGCRP